MSIKPKWVAKILNGKKTIEIRKTIPKCDLPIKVYIYCTKDSKKDYYYDKYTLGCYFRYYLDDNLGYEYSKNLKPLNGKVVACFTLDKVEEINTKIIENLKNRIAEDKKYNFPSKTKLTNDLLSTDFLKKSCLTIDELNDYFVKYEYEECFGERINISNGYAWHISNLEVFDKPKELSEFYNRYPKGDLPIGKWKHGLLAMKQVKRPPQSWCYIETDY